VKRVHRRRFIALLALLALFTVGLAVMLWVAGGPRPNILLLTIDTLRADRLGCYGGSARTPNIDRLARDGTLFENATAPVPATRPSHFTMLTARYPRELGEVSNRVALPADVPTLAEVFRAAGYRTGGFVGSILLGEKSGAARGFDTYDFPERLRERRAGRVVKRTVDWLASVRQPFFLWVHLYDPHMPYTPPPSFVPDGPPPWAQELRTISWKGVLAAAERRGGELPSEALARIEALYTAEVEKTDQWVGTLLNELATSGVLDRTVILFSADHGECFEHGYYFEHYECLYEGAARVPLIVRYPPSVAAQQRRTDVVEHVDLARTLLDIAGISAPASFAGTPLFGGPQRSARLAVIEHPSVPVSGLAGPRDRARRIQRVAGEPVRWPLIGREQFALRGTRWKYIVTGLADEGLADGGRANEELYDLAADPNERSNVAGDQPAIIAEMRQALQQWKQERSPRPVTPLPLPPAVEEALRALGYAR
jgi:arylsulfatase A-like enzyme